MGLIKIIAVPVQLMFHQDRTIAINILINAPIAQPEFQVDKDFVLVIKIALVTIAVQLFLIHRLTVIITKVLALIVLSEYLLDRLIVLPTKKVIVNNAQFRFLENKVTVILI